MKKKLFAQSEVAIKDKQLMPGEAFLRKKGFDVQESIIKNIDFRGVNLEKIQINGTVFINCMFDNLDFAFTETNSNRYNFTLNNCRVTDLSSLKEKEFVTRIHFINMDFKNVDFFSKKYLSDIGFTKCKGINIESLYKSESFEGFFENMDMFNYDINKLVAISSNFLGLVNCRNINLHGIEVNNDKLNSFEIITKYEKRYDQSISRILRCLSSDLTLIESKIAEMSLRKHKRRDQLNAALEEVKIFHTRFNQGESFPVIPVESLAELAFLDKIVLEADGTKKTYQWFPKKTLVKQKQKMQGVKLFDLNISKEKLENLRNDILKELELFTKDLELSGIDLRRNEKIVTGDKIFDYYAFGRYHNSRTCFIQIGPVFILDSRFKELCSEKLKKALGDNVIYLNNMWTNEIAAESALGYYTANTVASILSAPCEGLIGIDNGAGGGLLSIILARKGTSYNVLCDLEKDKILETNLEINGIHRDNYTFIQGDLNNYNEIVDHIYHLGLPQGDFIIVTNIGEWSHYSVTNIITLPQISALIKAYPDKNINTVITGGHDLAQDQENIYPRLWASHFSEHDFIRTIGCNPTVPDDDYEFGLGYKPGDEALKALPDTPIERETALFEAFGFKKSYSSVSDAIENWYQYRKPMSIVWEKAR